MSVVNCILRNIMGVGEGVVVCYVSTVGEHRLSLVGLEVVSKSHETQ